MQPADEQVMAAHRDGLVKPDPGAALPRQPTTGRAQPEIPDWIDGLEVVRVPAAMRLRAAERIVGGAGGDERGSRESAARRFVESAGQMGIDVSLMWGTLDPSARYFHQVCLIVIGAGRTAMLFLSEDDDEPEWDFGMNLSASIRRREPTSGIDQRALLVQHACRHLQTLRGPVVTRAGGKSKRIIGHNERSVILVQGLLETEETQAADALTHVGFVRLGDLVYMRRPLAGASSRRAAKPDTVNWPAGITVRPMSLIDPAEHDAVLGRALARSYIDTLDCPELCGLRSIDDVIDSHRAVGEMDLSKWWIIEENGVAEGAMLLSDCPDQSPPMIELVYLGLSPALRGRGLGAGLLKMGLASVSGGSATTIACAVDTRNIPAMKLYKRAGFQRFSVRVPMVRGLGE